MSKLLNRELKLAALNQRGDKYWTRGKLSSAFKSFLAAARGGFVPAFETVAQFYDNGFGTKADENAALYWYLRAYRQKPSWYQAARRQGLSTCANNIGCILRDRGERKKAIMWLQRAAKLGDGDANLNIAKIYLRQKGDRQNAIRFLQKTIAAPYVTDGSIEEAKALLKQLRTTNRRRGKKRN